jgi:hypothetical protein
MNQTYATELVRRLAPELKGELAVQPILPLQIKLHLERLKLMEIIRAANGTKPRVTVATAQVETQVAC